MSAGGPLPSVPARLAWAVGVAAFAFAASLPAWANPGFLFIAGLVLVQALFAMSWNILFGYAGLASFGHAGFFGIGAYTVGALLRYQVPLPFVLMLVCATLLGALVALVIGSVVLRRLSGIFLAVLTVALAEILRLVIGYARFLSAEDGLSNIPRPRVDLGFTVLDLASAEACYLFLLGVVCLAAVALWWLLHSRYGRLFQVIRQDPERAAFLGIDVARWRIVAFMISGAVAALAGALYAPWTRVVTLEELHWLQSLKPMLYTLLGGVGSFWGPAIGAAVFALIDYQTRLYPGVAELIVGTALILIILVAPAGIAGLVRRLLGASDRVGRGPEAGESS